MRLRGLSPPRLRAAATLALAIGASVVAGAASPARAAFSEYFGGYSICGSNCYVQSGAAHTFVLDEGSSGSGSPALACQLFNGRGVNDVSHGYGYCQVYYFGGAFVTARVYNQSGSTRTVYGYAET